MLGRVARGPPCLYPQQASPCKSCLHGGSGSCMRWGISPASRATSPTWNGEPHGAKQKPPGRPDHLHRRTGSPAVASRPAEAARCLEPRASTRTRVYHSQYARCSESILRTQQAHTNTRPMPASSWMGATCSRHAPRSNYIAGLLEVECEG
jgi:hypothetical protein